MDNLIGPNGEHITADTLRAQQARETQREVDARMAAWYSTSSEHATFAIEDVRRLYREVR